MSKPLQASNLLRAFILIAGLWVGALIAVGCLVTPIVFLTLGDRQVAGLVAGHIFKVLAIGSVSLSVVLMILANFLVSRGLNTFRLTRWTLLVMLACAFAEAYVIIPWMDSLRDQAIGVGMPVMASSWANLFTRLHKISSILFVVQGILGLFLIWRSTKPEIQ
jgi:Domain of unknown function (DUF4149)